VAVEIRDQAAIVGIGHSEFGRFLPNSQLDLAAKAFKAALEDSGLERGDIDGLSIHMGWPLGVDYDRVAEAFGLNIRYVNQTWLHGRFVTQTLQHAALAVIAGLADVVACITGISFTREREILGGPGDVEGNREEGGTHGEQPVYGLTAPAGGAALAMQRYMALYGATSEQLAAVPVAFRKHARLNPLAIMRKPMTVADHQNSRMVVDPLHLFDCCLITDGAAVVFVTHADRARDLRQQPVYISGMQGIRSGRDEFIFAPPRLGINQQPSGQDTPRESDLGVYRTVGVERTDVDALYTYDAFSPLVLFTLERFGFCGPGEAAAWVQGGRIELGGELPMNTSGGLLSEAHVGGWNSMCEIVRQLRGVCGERQIPDVNVIQWGTAWGDSIIFRNETL
jgi:acetyl-CoA acetyltransferase